MAVSVHGFKQAVTCGPFSTWTFLRACKLAPPGEYQPKLSRKRKRPYYAAKLCLSENARVEFQKGMSRRLLSGTCIYNLPCGRIRSRRPLIGRLRTAPDGSEIKASDWDGSDGSDGSDRITCSTTRICRQDSFTDI